MIIIKCILDSLIVYVHDVTTTIMRTAQKSKNKNRYEIFQHASLIARQNIPKCFLSPRTTLNICKVQESKSPIKLTSKKRKLNFLDHAKED